MASPRIPSMEDPDRSKLTPADAVTRFHDGTRVPMDGVLSPPTGDSTREMKRAMAMSGAAREIRIAYLSWWYRSHPLIAPVPLALRRGAMDKAPKFLRHIAAEVECLASASPGIDTKENSAAMLVAAFVAGLRAKLDRSRRKTTLACVEDFWPKVADDLRATAVTLRSAAEMLKARPGRRKNSLLNGYVVDLREGVRIPGCGGRSARLGDRRIALLCIGADVDRLGAANRGRYDLEAMIGRVHKIRSRHGRMHRTWMAVALERSVRHRT